MPTKTLSVNVRLAGHQHSYNILVGSGTLGQVGHTARQSLGSRSSRVVVISNRRVFDLYGAQAVRSLKGAKFNVTAWLMGDGERFKSFDTAQKALQFISKTGLERTDAIVALGGGVVGDLAGFAAATYLRGIPLIQVPTTLIAQIDSSVGGKTGVNLRDGKNLVGAFHQPHAVIIDVEMLKTLPAREIVAGWCEAIKNGAVSGRKLFEQTMRFLSRTGSGNAPSPSPDLERLISSHCAFKAEIVTQDELEDPTRTDNRSRRVLNFGHTVGHALEAATQYRRFRHGEAVGYGMLVAGEISKDLGLLPASELELLRDAIGLCGPLPSAADLDATQLMDSIRNDKKSIRGNVQWVLLEEIGRPRIVDGKKIASRLIRKALRRGLRSAS